LRMIRANISHATEASALANAADCNGYAMAHWPRRLNSLAVVADAGTNSLLEVGPRGQTTVLAQLPRVQFPTPVTLYGYTMASTEPVPTALAVGPDGDLYVGLLTGFPYVRGSASVLRVNRETGVISTYTSGLTNIVDLLFDPAGRLYVLEMSTMGLGAIDPNAGAADPALLGSIKRINDPADPATHETIATGFKLPGGMAYRRNYFYVSNCGVLPAAAAALARRRRHDGSHPATSSGSNSTTTPSPLASVPLCAGGEVVRFRFDFQTQ
jgi:hypothetical protein